MNKIGEGMTATIYSDGTYAYKAYHVGYPKANMLYECKIQNTIFNQTKLPVLHYELFEDTIKMPLVKGRSFADRIRVEKYKNWLDDFTRLQASTYTYKDIDLLNSFSVFEAQIKSSTQPLELKQKALAALKSMPKDTCLCHFDFHPLNIMYGEDTYTIIDWTNAKLGHPAMDIASTYIIFRQHLKRQANKYLNEMVKKTNVSLFDIKHAIPIMAFIKLNDIVESDAKDMLVDLIMKQDQIFES